MADDYRTDEEQIEAIKNWWDENGRSTVITVVLAIAGVFGWQQWQDSRQAATENAALQYQELLDAVSQPEQTASLVSTASHLSDELKSNHASSTYAHFAALHMAKLRVEDKQLGEAREQLQWILDNRAPDPAITSLARLRLARVVFAESGAQEALSVISNVEAGVYKASYAEFRGDLYDELGDLTKAEQQYNLAKEGVNTAAGNQNALLDMKYKSVARRLAANTSTDEVSSAAVTTPSAEEADSQSGTSESGEEEAANETASNEAGEE